jgi:hypothetical protein
MITKSKPRKQSDKSIDASGGEEAYCSVGTVDYHVISDKRIDASDASDSSTIDSVVGVVLRNFNILNKAGVGAHAVSYHRNRVIS